MKFTTIVLLICVVLAVATTVQSSGYGKKIWKKKSWGGYGGGYGHGGGYGKKYYKPKHYGKGYGWGR